ATSKFDLTLFTEPDPARGGALGCTIEYSSELFEFHRIERMARHLTKLLGAVVQDPEQPLSEIPILSEGERSKVLADFNATKREPKSNEQTVQELFAKQAALTPEAIAVEHGDKKRTYAELDREAEAWATHLVAHGIGPDVAVAVCFDR